MSYYHRKYQEATRKLQESLAWQRIAARWGYRVAAHMLRDRGNNLTQTLRLLGLNPRGK